MSCIHPGSAEGENLIETELLVLTASYDFTHHGGVQYKLNKLCGGRIQFVVEQLVEMGVGLCSALPVGFYHCPLVLKSRTLDKQVDKVSRKVEARTQETVTIREPACSLSFS